MTLVTERGSSTICGHRWGKCNMEFGATFKPHRCMQESGHIGLHGCRSCGTICTEK